MVGTRLRLSDQPRVSVKPKVVWVMVVKSGDAVFVTQSRRGTRFESGHPLLKESICSLLTLKKRMTDFIILKRLSIRVLWYPESRTAYMLNARSVAVRV